MVRPFLLGVTGGDAPGRETYSIHTGQVVNGPGYIGRRLCSAFLAVFSG